MLPFVFGKYSVVIALIVILLFRFTLGKQVQRRTTVTINCYHGYVASDFLNSHLINPQFYLKFGQKFRVCLVCSALAQVLPKTFEPCGMHYAVLECNSPSFQVSEIPNPNSNTIVSVVGSQTGTKVALGEEVEINCSGDDYVMAFDVTKRAIGSYAECKEDPDDAELVELSKAGTNAGTDWCAGKFTNLK